jgi:hypothetical protein
MKITYFTLTLLLFCFFKSFGQTNYSVKGTVADTSANVNLAGTTVTVLNAKDSILRAFTWTDEKGGFNINKLSKGKYLILFSYPGYANYTDNFTLDSAKSSFDFGKINMILKERLLKDVIIKGEVTAIKIKGDTTEYNARAYKIQPNDKVEDLLKQLPGIEVDKDGKITAQGQTAKVLLDGEEFFGDDPTLITKNIRADMVDKVQVYDKKSDQATFTGIDDGVKDKTINIKLKSDKKDGYFGKANAGVATDKYYEDQLLYNRFKDKMKFSVYGILGNDGKTGLGWEDSQKAGIQSENVQFGDDGGVSIFFDGNGDDLDSFDGQYNGQGLPIARTGGVHYDNKWNNDKQSINTNYKIGSIQVDGTSDNLIQQNFADSIIKSNSSQNFHKFMFRQKLDVTYETKLDTTQTLKFTADGTDKHSDVLENNLSSSYLNNNLLNNNDRQVTNHVNQKAFDASLFYTKKFKKKGRTLSVLASEKYNQSDAKGYLKANTNFYGVDSITHQSKLDSTQVINQLKTLSTVNSLLLTNITYTEPLTKKLSLVANYGFSLDNGTSNRRTYDSTAVGRYDLLNDTLSNDYKLNQVSNQVGAILNYKLDKQTINFGTKVSDVSFTQTDLFAGHSYKRTFIDWLPQASYQYRFSQQQSIRIGYNGNTTQPTIQQLQPVANNTDNLNITIGNPNLKPSFSNNINVGYNSYKVISGQSIGVYGNFRFTNNPIVSNTNTDINTGQTFYQSVNLPGKIPYNFYAYAYAGQKIGGDFRLNEQINTNGSTSYNYTNNVLNTTNSYSYSGTFGISKYVVKKYDFNLGFGPGYNISESSLQSQVNNNGVTYNGYGYFNVYLPLKFQVSSNANYQFTGKTASFPSNFSQFILNATIAKTFFKDDALKFSISGNDLLNQNVGFSRTANGNSITQNSYTTIKRYFMFSVSWDFNHMSAGVPTK